jgi:phosphoglycerate dehydrogenase-like enzyme
MKIAIQPTSRIEFEKAVEAGGCEVAALSPDVRAMVWTDYSQPELLRATLDENPQLEWVQLPFAGVDAFADVIQRTPLFTSAKGAYSQPVAEHVLALMLGLGRAIPERVRAKTWGNKFAVSLYESRVLVVGAGGIAQELVRLLEPFGCPIVVLGRNDVNRLELELPRADFVVLACALTDSTRGLMNSHTLGLMKTSAYLVNVARGQVVDTQALVEALQNKVIAGAGLDVTDPEPLPDGHSLWSEPNCIITPHTADTPAQVIRMFANRILENAKAYRSQTDFVGVVDKTLGY